MTATALAEQNERLETELAGLRERVGQLTVSLAEAMAELDVERSRPRGEEAGQTETAGRDALDVVEWTVVDVNRGLNMVVFDGGAIRGVKPGLRFKIVRDRKSLATARAVDVREKISGALIEEVGGDAYPQKGDRVLLAR